MVSEKADIAEQVYEAYVVSNKAKQDMVEEIVELRYENQILQEGNMNLREKIKQTYDFMKQISMDGISLWEHFTQHVKHAVQAFTERGRGNL